MFYIKKLNYIVNILLFSVPTPIERPGHLAPVRTLLSVPPLLLHVRNSAEREQSSDDVAQRIHLRRDGPYQDGDGERRANRLPANQRNILLQRRRKGLRHVKGFFLRLRSVIL